MSSETGHNSVPVGVSSLDVESLEELGLQYRDQLQNDVRVIGQPIVEKVHIADSLKEKIIQKLGGTAAGNQHKIVGITTVEETERTILREARRIQSPRVRLYSADI